MDTDQQRRKDKVKELIWEANTKSLSSVTIPHTLLDSEFHNELAGLGFKILYDDKRLLYVILWSHWTNEPIETEPDGYFNKVANNHLPPSGY